MNAEQIKIEDSPNFARPDFLKENPNTFFPMYDVSVGVWWAYVYDHFYMNFYTWPIEQFSDKEGIDIRIGQSPYATRTVKTIHRSVNWKAILSNLVFNTVRKEVIQLIEHHEEDVRYHSEKLSYYVKLLAGGNE